MARNNPCALLSTDVAGDRALSRAGFPSGLCLLSVAITWLGLAASAAGLKWGAAPAPGDALRSSWPYVQMMWVVMWLVGWPMAALRPARLAAGGGIGRLFWEWVAVAIGAIPAVTMGSFLSNISAPAIGCMTALQVSWSLLAMGMLAWATRPGARAMAACIAGLLAMLAFAGPVLVYLQNEFFPTLWSGWFIGVPAIAVFRAAPADPSALPPALWWTAAGDAVIGLALLWTATTHHRAPKPADS